MQQQMNFLDSLCGKMSPEHSVQTKAKTSERCYKPSQMSQEQPVIMFLDLRVGGGNLLGAYWEMDGALPGEFMMLNTGASPNAVRESTLSQIIIQSAPEKYSLSPRACAGIIRRAEKRGKELPDMLKEALMETIGLAGGLNMIEDEPEEEQEEDIDEDIQ